MLSRTRYDEYCIVNMYAVRQLLQNESVAVQDLYFALCQEMSFYTFRGDLGQYVSIDTEEQRNSFEVGAGMSWRTIRRYLPILIKKGLIRKNGNGSLQINPEYAYKGDGKKRAAACRHWHDTAC